MIITLILLQIIILAAIFGKAEKINKVWVSNIAAVGLLITSWIWKGEADVVGYWICGIIWLLVSIVLYARLHRQKHLEN